MLYASVNIFIYTSASSQFHKVPCWYLGAYRPFIYEKKQLKNTKSSQLLQNKSQGFIFLEAIVSIDRLKHFTVHSAGEQSRVWATNDTN